MLRKIFKTTNKEPQSAESEMPSKTLNTGNLNFILGEVSNLCLFVVTENRKG